jgi:hypothetical protein
VGIVKSKGRRIDRMNSGKKESKGFFLQLSENDVSRLPVSSPIGRRIFVILEKEGSAQETRELFVQRSDAFATNMFGLIKGIKDGDITEIRYAVGFDGLVRVFKDENQKVVGEFFSESESTMLEFKRKMQIP